MVVEIKSPKIPVWIFKDHVFKKAYGNLNDATLHSTTYNGFGEETVTAIEAINIIIEDDYISKSKHIVISANFYGYVKFFSVVSSIEF